MNHYKPKKSTNNCKIVRGLSLYLNQALKQNNTTFLLKKIETFCFRFFEAFDFIVRRKYSKTLYVQQDKFVYRVF